MGVLLVLVGLLALADGPIDTVNRQVPDRSYRPKPGDRAVACFYDRETFKSRPADGATYSFAYSEYWKSIHIKDYDGIGELRKKDLLVKLEVGTDLLVIDLEEFEKSDARADCAVVRVMSGLHKGKKLWVSKFEVVQLTSNPNFKENPGKKAAPTSENDKASASDLLLQEAVQFERDDAPDDALVTYQLVLKRYPGTDNAKTAAGRVEALGKKSGAAKTKAAEAKSKSALAIARSHEKDGRKAAALKSYKAIMKDYPGTEAAREAAERVKALEKP